MILLWSDVVDTIKRDFSDEKKNIENFFEYIKNQESNAGLSVNPMQKSSCILMLYNLIESMFTKVLTHIHLMVLNGSFQYQELNGKIRKTVFKYHSHFFDDIDQHHSELECFLYIVNNTKKVEISYEKMSNIYQLFSGNLDSRIIIGVLENKYGFLLKNKNKLQETALQTIKKGRNILAHGEQSFEEYGRMLSIQEINDKRNKVFEFIDNLIIECEYYLNQKDYLEK